MTCVAHEKILPVYAKIQCFKYLLNGFIFFYVYCHNLIVTLNFVIYIIRDEKSI